MVPRVRSIPEKYADWRHDGNLDMSMAPVVLFTASSMTLCNFVFEKISVGMTITFKPGLNVPWVKVPETWSMTRFCCEMLLYGRPRLRLK